MQRETVATKIMILWWERRVVFDILMVSAHLYSVIFASTVRWFVFPIMCLSYFLDFIQDGLGLPMIMEYGNPWNGIFMIRQSRLEEVEVKNRAHHKPHASHIKREIHKPLKYRYTMLLQQLMIGNNIVLYNGHICDLKLSCGNIGLGPHKLLYLRLALALATPL